LYEKVVNFDTSSRREISQQRRDESKSYGATSLTFSRARIDNLATEKERNAELEDQRVKDLRQPAELTAQLAAIEKNNRKNKDKGQKSDDDFWSETNISAQ
jgi:hypothetical protein